MGEAQKTIEDDDVIDDDDSEDDGASSIGSSSVDHTDESSDLELVKEEGFKEEFYLMFSTLDEFELDENLRTSDGKYLTNVDGRYVFEWNDIATLVGDGKAHRLHFKDTPNKVQRTKQAEVCFKPLYKTLKRVQVRSGPGSKFESTGIVGANQQVISLKIWCTTLAGDRRIARSKPSSNATFSPMTKRWTSLISSSLRPMTSLMPSSSTKRLPRPTEKSTSCTRRMALKNMAGSAKRKTAEL